MINGLILHYFFYNLKKKNNQLNQQTINYNIAKPKKIKKLAIDRDRYSIRKIPKDLDHNFIGSGIGGICCHAFLSHMGTNVLVL